MYNSGYFLSYVDGLGASYAHPFLASTHARFCKELDREMSNKRRFLENFPIKRSCPENLKQQIKLCFCPGRL